MTHFVVEEFIHLLTFSFIYLFIHSLIHPPNSSIDSPFFSPSIQVLGALPSRIRPTPEAVHLRVLPEIHEKSADSRASRDQMRLESAAARQ